jgi:chromosome segregation ATPase
MNIVLNRFLVLLIAAPLLASCNKSEPSSDDGVFQSTFDAMSAELDKARDALAKAEHDKAELAAQLQTTIIESSKKDEEKAGIADEKNLLQATLDAKLNELSVVIAQLDQSEKKITATETARDDWKKKFDLADEDYEDAKKSSDEHKRLYDEAVKAGNLTETARVALETSYKKSAEDLKAAETARDESFQKLTAAEESLSAARTERDDFKKQLEVIVKERDLLLKQKEKLVELICSAVK